MAVLNGVAILAHKRKHVMEKFKATKINDCCYLIEVGDEYVGVWCPISRILAIGGEIVGIASSLEDLEKRLTKIPIMVWGLKEDD